MSEHVSVFKNLVVTEDFTASNVEVQTNSKFPDGTVSAPSMTFTNDTNTGIYRIGNDTLGITTGGVQRVQVSDTDVFLGGTHNLTVPGTLHMTSTGANGTVFHKTRVSVTAATHTINSATIRSMSNQWIIANLASNSINITINFTAEAQATDTFSWFPLSMFNGNGAKTVTITPGTNSAAVPLSIVITPPSDGSSLTRFIMMHHNTSSQVFMYS
jgi:hypothetical protein